MVKHRILTSADKIMCTKKRSTQLNELKRTQVVNTSMSLSFFHKQIKRVHLKLIFITSSNRI